MTDETFRIIEAEARLAVSAILTRYGVAHSPEYMAITIMDVPVDVMPPSSKAITSERTEQLPASSGLIAHGHTLGLTFHSVKVLS